MKRVLLAAILLSFVIVVSGCTNNSTGSGVQDFVGRQGTGMESSAKCINANVRLETATWNNNELVLSLDNYGRAVLSFDFVISYANQPDLQRVPGPVNVSAGAKEVFTIENVSSDIQTITIKSSECAGVQDMLMRSDITGLSQ